jgi:DNA-binding XRE family transcriptional regulator
MKKTPDYLKAIRTSHGMTQAEFGAIIGRRKWSVQEYERGVAPIPNDVWERLATWEIKPPLQVRLAAINAIKHAAYCCTMAAMSKQDVIDALFPVDKAD